MSRRTSSALACLAVLAGLGTTSSNVEAKPPAPAVFCETYADAPACAQQAAACTTCHSVPPALNLYGEQLSEVLLPDQSRPLSDPDFAEGLPDALAAVEELDADGDGFANFDELIAGADPSTPASVPISTDAECNANDVRPVGLDVCAYDPVYVFKKIRIDFCGLAPTYDEMQDFAQAPTTERLHQTLDECLDSEFWIGKDGVVWNMANSKIKPIQAIKSGEGAGPIPLADYDDDYNFFVYANSDDHDARDLLLGDYFVERTDDPTTYATWDRTLAQDYSERGYEVAQAVNKQYRNGMITHRWFLMSNTMFTSIPRTTAAQAYRAYLGFDISRLEGLEPVDGEPVDYDSKGVDRAECAVCHSTLDPLTYPFSRYEGIGGGADLGEGYIPFTYNASRMYRFKDEEGDLVGETPQEGYIFGEKVANLNEWAEVAANSDAFAQAHVADFWELLLGQEPQPGDLDEFDGVWRRFMTDHEYQTEKMLHDLVMTEAYGVP